ncbi:hypothetical protein BC826DRAFT_1105045 [Russula brevipes]|nr:hypothetical protein BC826DRAFT_1105045 [Russula brevipes]
MGDAFIGGWAHTCIGTNPSTPSAARHQWERRCSIGHSFVLQTGYPFLHEPPRPASTIRPGVRPSFDENLLPQLNPVERSRITNLAGATYTFWRFLIQIPLGDSEMEIHYSINNGNEMLFFVPGRQQTMRLAAYSVRDTLSFFRSILTGVDLCSVMDSASMRIQMNFVDLDSMTLTTPDQSPDTTRRTQIDDA